MTGEREAVCEDRLRASLRRKLPKLIRKTVADYARFVTSEPPPDAKGFAGHQAAGKAAVAHLDAAFKLLDWAQGGVPPVSEGTGPQVDQLIRQAETALAALDDQENDHEPGEVPRNAP